jgi:hypothetical protein
LQKADPAIRKIVAAVIVRTRAPSHGRIEKKIAPAKMLSASEPILEIAQEMAPFALASGRGAGAFPFWVARETVAAILHL